MSSKKQFAVLLTDEGWVDLEKAVQPFVAKGPIGNYLYCDRLVVDPPFAEMSFGKGQVEALHHSVLVRIPLHYVKYTAEVDGDDDRKTIGFV